MNRLVCFHILFVSFNCQCLPAVEVPLDSASGGDIPQLSCGFPSVGASGDPSVNLFVQGPNVATSFPQTYALHFIMIGDWIKGGGSVCLFHETLEKTNI
jgi:hypothetical protein